jgi:Fe-S-cluster-containing hydrogenase component 2
LACEESCPTGAIEAESGDADKGRCIACLACISNCPEDALKINDMSESWPIKLQKENTSLESLKEQTSRVYS